MKPQLNLNAKAIIMAKIIVKVKVNVMEKKKAQAMDQEMGKRMNISATALGIT